MPKTVQQYLDSIPNAKSRGTYKFALQKFFKTLSLDPDNYLSTNRNYGEDIERFFVILSEKNTPPMSIRLQLSAIKGYLLDSDVELKETFWKKINGRIKGKKARFQDEVPENNVPLKQILGHMDVRGRALFLVIVSSGMRIGETLKVKLQDLDLEREPAKITLRGEYTKNGDGRVVFITSEAKDALKAWLSKRNAWLLSSVNKGKSLGVKKSADDERVFPIHETVAMGIWNTALEKAGLTKFDSTVKRRTLHIHVLRKYFRTVMGKLNVDYAETLMGHEGYLTGSYRRHSTEELAKWYLDNQHHLYVFTDASEVVRIKKEIDQRYQEQDDKIEALTAEKKMMNFMMNSMSEKLEALTQRMKRYEEHTKKFMEMTPDEFGELISQISRKKEESLEMEYKETLKQEQEENKQILEEIVT